MRTVFIVLRIAVPLAIIAAIVGQLMVSYEFWTSKGVEHISINFTNFFSFFTVESNLASAIFLPIGAWFLIANRDSDPQWFLVVRACLTTYMVTTGIVYNLLLRGIELPQGSTLGWSNEILHVVAPIYLLLDWLFAPGRRALPYKTVWIVVIFPIVWALYTLIRGPLTIDEIFGQSYWYPYPFLNPNLAPTGYASVAFYVALISVLIAAVGFGVVWVSRRISKHLIMPLKV